MHFAFLYKENSDISSDDTHAILIGNDEIKYSQHNWFSLHLVEYICQLSNFTRGITLNMSLVQCC